MKVQSVTRVPVPPKDGSWAVVKDVYAALERLDAESLLRLMRPDATARISAGMPLGVGGNVQGAEALMTDVWGVLAGAFDVKARPEEFVVDGDDRVIVFGTYFGVCVSTGRRLEAAFVHDWRLEGERVRALIQVTDTAAWNHALEAVGTFSSLD